MAEDHLITFTDDADGTTGTCACGWSRRVGHEALVLDGLSRHDALRRAHAQHMLVDLPAGSSPMAGSPRARPRA